MTRSMAQAVAQYLEQRGLEAQVMAASGQGRTPRDGWAVVVRDSEKGPLFAITSVVSLGAAEE